MLGQDDVQAVEESGMGGLADVFTSTLPLDGIVVLDI